jgi:hypothetical protein
MTATVIYTDPWTKRPPPKTHRHIGTCDCCNAIGVTIEYANASTGNTCRDCAVVTYRKSAHTHDKVARK